MKLVRAFFAVSLAFVASGVPVGCSGGVVGGDCRVGYVQCNGICIDVQNRVTDCGSCGNVCAVGNQCVAGSCVPPAPDASTGGTANHPDGSLVDSGAGGSFGGDASSTGGAPSDGSTGGTTPSSGGASTGGANDASTGGTSSGGAGPDASLDGGLDASSGGRGGSGGRDASQGGTGGVRDAGPHDSGLLPDGAPRCQPPYNTPEHCGDCDTQCTGVNDICQVDEAEAQCVTVCTPPLVDCNRTCVNTDNDPNNCGSCNHHCASGICQGGTCVGATAGHEVVACMDFATRPGAGTPQQTLLGNAVFLTAKNPVRIYAYRQFTPNAVVNSVNGAIAAVATARGRTYSITPETDSTQVPLNLSIFDYEVLLVYDQPNAPAGRLANVGTSWASAVDSFVRAGGTAVVLAGDAGTAEMDDLVTNAGLLTVTGQTSVTGDQVYNRAPADAVGLNVLTPFLATAETCTFTTPPPPDSTTVFVITDTASSTGSLGSPIVVHRVLAP